jgi:beta-lactamase superfamily II metal-dependent hydrolase
MVKIHFLNVGHGDCIIIENFATGRNTVIDINRSSAMDKNSMSEVNESYIGLASRMTFSVFLGPTGLTMSLLELKGYGISLTDPIDYIRRNCIGRIHRFISTHPHMDHISGLSALHREIGFTNFWAAEHNWSPSSSLTESQASDWEFYNELVNNNVTDVTLIRPLERDSRSFLDEDGLYILAPNKAILGDAGDNANHISYVILFKYAGRKILFGGDAESMTWDYISTNYSDLISGVDILKASHHGRDSGYHQPSLNLMRPQYTVVSVGKKPKTDSSNKYRNYSEKTWSTRWKGNIVFSIDSNGIINFDCEYDR